MGQEASQKPKRAAVARAGVGATTTHSLPTKCLLLEDWDSHRQVPGAVLRGHGWVTSLIRHIPAALSTVIVSCVFVNGS